MVESGSDFDPVGFDIVVNATSLGLNGQGPLPIDVSRVPREGLVAEVVMVPEITPLLEATQECGLAVVTGREMLLQEIEVCADFLGMTN